MEVGFNSSKAAAGRGEQNKKSLALVAVSTELASTPGDVTAQSC